ncbi:MAG: ribosome maturation factor RimM [Eubacteriales bacterium]|nr:ribosome maturation factor RimM [Eubacteriales bacterium]MDY3333131.1 ribosome maturation factor RimM [Gallibacter sp.]
MGNKKLINKDFVSGILSDEYIEIGKIVNAVGLKGEVKVYNYSDEIDRFETTSIYVLGDGSKLNVQNVRYKGNIPIVKFEEINDRNEAEACKNKTLYVKRSDLPELPEGVFYIRDIIGMAVVEENGDEVGVLEDVRTDTPQRIYIVKTKTGEILIPGVDEFILNIDMDLRTITVRLIEGMI